MLKLQKLTFLFVAFIVTPHAQTSFIWTKTLQYPLFKVAAKKPSFSANYSVSIYRGLHSFFELDIKIRDVFFSVIQSTKKEYKVSFGLLFPDRLSGETFLKTGIFYFNGLEGPFSQMTLRNPFLRIIIFKIFAHSWTSPLDENVLMYDPLVCQKVVKRNASKKEEEKMEGKYNIFDQLWIDLVRFVEWDKQEIEHWSLFDKKEGFKILDEWSITDEVKTDTAQWILQNQNSEELRKLEKILEEKGDLLSVIPSVSP